MINHDFPWIHQNWIKQINHNLTTQEVIEEEIDFKNLSPCGLSMIEAHWTILSSIQLRIVPPFEANWGDWHKAATKLSNEIRTYVNNANLGPTYKTMMKDHNRVDKICVVSK